LPILRAIARNKRFGAVRLAKSRPHLARAAFRFGHPLVWFAAQWKYRHYTFRHGSEVVKAVLFQPQATFSATAAELETIEPFLTTLPDRLPKPQIPLAIIASAQPVDRHRFPGTSREALLRYSETHRRLQHDLTKLSSRAEFILDRVGTHVIPLENPGLLIRQIRKVVNTVMRK
jgi:hypothetical protein